MDDLTETRACDKHGHVRRGARVHSSISPRAARMLINLFNVSVTPLVQFEQYAAEEETLVCRRT